MRIGREQMFMEIAHVVAKRSTCFRLNVGAVVVRDDRVISIGYNGAPPGAPHCTGASCPGAKQCTRTIHAEENAFLYAFRQMPPVMAGDQGRPLGGCDLYVTDSPCQHCAELIFNYGIERVLFGKPYRITDPLDWLHDRGVLLFQITPAGYHINWISKEI